MTQQITIYRTNVDNPRDAVDPQLQNLLGFMLESDKRFYFWIPNTGSFGVYDVSQEFHDGILSILGEMEEEPLSSLGGVHPNLAPVLEDVFDPDTGEKTGEEYSYEIVALWVKV